jgi:MoaA/NifB/PqqE/SkfB family radical SAM enzyme
MIERYDIWNVQSELRPTKMVVIDLLRPCNNSCTICYHRYTTFDSPEGKRENWIKSLDEVKRELKKAKLRGCNRFESTGGEPLLHPNIVEIIKYSKEIGLEPRIITNGNHEVSKYDDVIDAGCRDFLFSFHTLGKDHDKMTQVKGSYERMLNSLNHIISRGCNYATNTVIYKDNFKVLPEIIKTILGQKKKPYLINFINCNPQYEPTHKNTHRDISARVSESQPFIQHSIDLTRMANVWLNLRYFPMCVLDTRYRKNIVNFPQVFFDWRNEWDYGHNNKTVENYLNHAYSGFINPASHREGVCGECSMRDVCGGINKKYIDCYGEKELKSQMIKSNDPNYYRKEQEMTTIIIPAYNPDGNLTRLLTEIQHKTAPPYNLVIVRGMRSASRNRNEGLMSVSDTSAFIIQIDDDICELPYMWNKRLTDRLLYDPEIMSVSARLMTTDGRIALNSADNFNIETEYEEVNLIPTACIAFRVQDIKLYNLKFNELMVASGWEDTEFIMKLKHNLKRAGLGTKIIIDNNCKVVHLNNATGQGKWNDYNKQIFEKEMEKL